MAVYVSAPRFTEENDARPTYITAAVGIGLIAADHIFQLTPGPHSRTLYLIAIFVIAISWISGLYCLLGCIWHPIPPERLRDGALSPLHLETATDVGSTEQAAMFSSFDDLTTEDDGSVDSSQVELRSPVQWSKLFFILGLMSITTCLMVIWNH